MPDEALVTEPGSQPFAEAVEGGDGGRPWLIAGVVIALQSPRPEGLVVADQTRQVAIWQAASPSGPWTRSEMSPVPGQDGPNETVLYLSHNRSRAVAFGSRASPTEGYPRPSAWTESPTGWTEVLEPRELFGGPNIVGFAGMESGPHGFFIAGTWSDSHGHAEASVWSSTDGSTWRRISDPSFEGLAGETPFGEGIADNSTGVVLAATAEAPSPGDPEAQRGVLWYSPNGQQWLRLAALPSGNSTFGAIAPAGSGWIVAGSVGAAGDERAAVWTVDRNLRVSKAELLPGPRGDRIDITTLSSDGSRLLVGGVADGRPALWSATLDHDAKPSRWQQETPPASRPPDLQRVTASIGTGGTIIALVGKTTTEVWHT